MYKRQDQGGALRIATRWPALFAFVAACFVGRLVLRYALDQWRARQLARDQADTPAKEVSLATNPLLNWIGWVALGVSVALPIVFAENRYVVDTATTVLIYVMLGWGLNVVVGLAGLLDLGYVAFYAVGAYTYGLLSVSYTHLDVYKRQNSLILPLIPGATTVTSSAKPKFFR